ncbi:Scr1 family TA system antitoxin-like transcriptional regulator [Nocardiopsis sp. N85]|uniref:Scr1 family TA system antitoxin-like transcriptional regulator n=1 Tax=Nocardiopsis sp. N85 TaxID=3029400 RepID=UPI00237F05E5|nr:Scr1 family TA system antitoxin-like transcriptional regulator [Nocardiopsis sp. N85]MDE3721784.1 Scr1 family TA system antitoxin-like transcriptional regulator [Nocardiopsis sp. N85]
MRSQSATPSPALCAPTNEEADPRHRQGRRHQLGCIVLIALCAMPAGARSLTAIGQWAANAPQHTLTRLGARIACPALGIRRPPSSATIRRVLTGLDPGALTLQRQQNLDQRREETSLDVILDESVLLRVVGGAAVMRRQLARMVEMVEGAKATIRILPLAQGVHAGSSESFVILDLPGEALKPIPYIETVAGDLYLEKPDDIATCETAWTYLEGLALDAEDSAAKIREIMKVYEKDAEGGA